MKNETEKTSERLAADPATDLATAVRIPRSWESLMSKAHKPVEGLQGRELSPKGCTNTARDGFVLAGARCR